MQTRQVLDLCQGLRKNWFWNGVKYIFLDKNKRKDEKRKKEKKKEKQGIVLLPKIWVSLLLKFVIMMLTLWAYTWFQEKQEHCKDWPVTAMTYRKSPGWGQLVLQLPYLRVHALGGNILHLIRGHVYGDVFYNVHKNEYVFKMNLLHNTPHK